MSPPPRRRPAQLSEHIGRALRASVARVLAEHPHKRAEMAEWLETAHEHVLVTARVGRQRSGRIDTRSLLLDCSLSTSAGTVPLVSVRARDLVDDDGVPFDVRSDVRTLLLQLGIGIPDSLAELDGSGEQG